MAKLIHDGTNLLGLRKSDAEEALFPVPAGALTIAFDEGANAGVIDALDSDWNSHGVSNGALVRNGTPVTIAADGTDKQDRDRARQAVSALRSGTLTLVQTQKVLAGLIALLDKKGVF